MKRLLCGALLAVAACKKPEPAVTAQPPAPVARRPLTPKNPRLLAALEERLDGGSDRAVLSTMEISVPLLPLDPRPPEKDGPPIRHLAQQPDAGGAWYAFTDLESLRAFWPDGGFTAYRGDQLRLLATSSRVGLVLQEGTPLRLALSASQVAEGVDAGPPPLPPPGEGTGVDPHGGH